MTTYTAITNGEIDQDSPVTQALMTALRDNPLAIGEGTAGAPVAATGWHPYNKVTVGDSNTGLIYDFGVSGAVASVITPDFADGYEYAFFFDGVSFAGDNSLRIDLYKEVDAAYQNLVASTTVMTNTLKYTGVVRLLLPRLAKYTHQVTWETDLTADASGAVAAAAGASFSMWDATQQKILRARIQNSSGTNIDLGKIYMLRSREYVTA